MFVFVLCYRLSVISIGFVGKNMDTSVNLSLVILEFIIVRNCGMNILLLDYWN